jgi:hypothetical protein
LLCGSKLGRSVGLRFHFPAFLFGRYRRRTFFFDLASEATASFHNFFAEANSGGASARAGSCGAPSTTAFPGLCAAADLGGELVLWGIASAATVSAGVDFEGGRFVGALAKATEDFGWRARDLPRGEERRRRGRGRAAVVAGDDTETDSGTGAGGRASVEEWSAQKSVMSCSPCSSRWTYGSCPNQLCKSIIDIFRSGGRGVPPGPLFALGGRWNKSECL